MFPFIDNTSQPLADLGFPRGMRQPIITVRNDIAKVMFLQACVCPEGGLSASVHGGIPPPGSRHPPGADNLPPGADPLGAATPQKQTPPQRDTPRSRHPARSRHHPPGADTPTRDGHCCGRYASYWNAFLFSNFFGLKLHKIKEIGAIRVYVSLAPPWVRQWSQ